MLVRPKGDVLPAINNKLAQNIHLPIYGRKRLIRFWFIEPSKRSLNILNGLNKITLLISQRSIYGMNEIPQYGGKGVSSINIEILGLIPTNPQCITKV
jgi:hypothetical protein